MHAEEGEKKGLFWEGIGKICTSKSELPKTSYFSPDGLGVPPHNRGLQLGLQFHQEWDRLINPSTAYTASNKPERPELNSKDADLNMSGERPQTREAHGICESKRKGCIVAHLR